MAFLPSRAYTSGYFFRAFTKSILGLTWVDSGTIFLTLLLPFLLVRQDVAGALDLAGRYFEIPKPVRYQAALRRSRTPSAPPSAGDNLTKQAENSENKVFFQGNLCYHGVDERIRLQEHKLWGIFPGPRGPENRFLTAVAKAAA